MSKNHIYREIDWSQPYLNSKDIQNAYEKLFGEKDAVEAADYESSDERYDAISEWELDYEEEFDKLKTIVEQGETIRDWYRGVTLIRDADFYDYIREFININYNIGLINENKGWPYNHIILDYYGAAEEVKSDYAAISYGDETWFVYSS